MQRQEVSVAVWRRMGAVLLVLMSAGCVSRVEPTPATGAVREPPTERTAAAVLGDLPTLDPCGLTDLEVFDEFGTAAFGVPESLDHCAITLTIGADDTDVSVGWLHTMSGPDRQARRVKELAGGMYVQQTDVSEGYCTQELVFPDDIVLHVDAAAYSHRPANVCPIVTAAMAAVIDVVEQGRVEHRDPADDSLIRVDPCTLVSDATITAQTGYGGARRQERPAHHQCRWETPDGPDRFSIAVGFTVGTTPSVVEGGSTTVIAGRSTVTNPYPQVQRCSVVAEHIAFAPLVREQVEVLAFTPEDRVDDGCRAALAVANEVWPRLPRR